MKTVSNLIKVFSLLVLFTATPLLFAAGSIFPDPDDKTDPRTQAEIRAVEAKIELYKLRLSNEISSRDRYIRRENLSWWEQRQNSRVREYNRKIKDYEDQIKKDREEITRLRRRLR